MTAAGALFGIAVIFIMLSVLRLLFDCGGYLDGAEGSPVHVERSAWMLSAWIMVAVLAKVLSQ